MYVASTAFILVIPCTHTHTANLGVPMDTENEESGIAECYEQQDSGLPKGELIA